MSRRAIARWLENNTEVQEIAMADYSTAITATIEAPWSTDLSGATPSQIVLRSSFLDVDPESITNATITLRSGKPWTGATVIVHNTADAAEDLLIKYLPTTTTAQTTIVTLSQGETVTVRCVGDDRWAIVSAVGTST